MREAQRLQRAIFSILIIALFMGQWVSSAQIAHAQNPVGVPTVPADTAANVATAGAQKATLVQTTLETAKSFAMHFKEFIGDSLATMVAKTVLRTITQSTVNWINSGFKGSPAFVTNPEGFLADITDQVVGQTIEELVPFVCSPFQLDIRVALGLNFSFNTQREIHCRLSDVIANVNGAYNAFVGGDFGAGGWSSWIAITGSPQNNPYGAYLSTVSAINARMVNAAGQEIKLLDWGKGFMSWRECEVPGNPYTPVKKDGTPRKDSAGNNLVRYGPCQKKGPIKTPGSVIESNLATALGADLNALGVADEINEVFAALVNQLIKQVFTSTGLAGASNYSGSVDTGQITESYVQGTATDLNSVRSAEGSIQSQADADAGGRATSISGRISGDIDAATGSYDFSSGSYAPVPRTGNIALYKYAIQSSRHPSGQYSPSRAVDGSEDGDYASAYTNTQTNPWWQVDLSRSNDRSNRYTIEEITEIQIIPHPSYFAGASIYISENEFSENDNKNNLEGKSSFKMDLALPSNGVINIIIPPGVKGPYIRIQRETSGYLSLREVRVYGTETVVSSQTRQQSISVVSVGSALALNKKVSQSTTDAEGSTKSPELAVDNGGDTTYSSTQSEQNPWWQADLSEDQAKNRYQIEQITRVAVSPLFPLPTSAFQDYVVFSKEPLSTNDSVESDICARKIIPNTRSYSIPSYSKENNGGAIVPSTEEKFWNLRIQRCNLGGTSAPLKLQNVIAYGGQRTLQAGATPTLPTPTFNIFYSDDNTNPAKDITDGEILLRNPANIKSDIFISTNGNQTQTGLRIGVKLQSAVGGTSTLTNEVFSARFNSFLVYAESLLGNAANWGEAFPTLNFVITGNLCSNGLTRCMNSEQIPNAYTTDIKNADIPITFLPNFSLTAGSKLKIHLNGEFPKNALGQPVIPGGEYKIILQIFRKDGTVPVASAAIRFTK